MGFELVNLGGVAWKGDFLAESVHDSCVFDWKQSTFKIDFD